jgi:hypothetical protein
MKFILGVLIILLLALTISCGSSPSTIESVDGENVNFMQLSTHYFVSTKYSGETNPSYLIIRSYPVFDSLFGIAVAMGTEDFPVITEDKIKSGFILSIIYQVKDYYKLDIEKITLKNNQLQVYYTSEMTIANVGGVNCHVTALVENCEFDSVLFFENGHLLPDASVKEFTDLLPEY